MRSWRSVTTMRRGEQARMRESSVVATQCGVRDSPGKLGAVPRAAGVPDELGACRGERADVGENDIIEAGERAPAAVVDEHRVDRRALELCDGARELHRERPAHARL